MCVCAVRRGCGVCEGRGSVDGYTPPHPPPRWASGCGGIDPSAPRSAVRLRCNPQFRRRPLEPLEASQANSLHSLTPHYLSLLYSSLLCSYRHFTATTITHFLIVRAGRVSIHTVVQRAIIVGIATTHPT